MIIMAETETSVNESAENVSVQDAEKRQYEKQTPKRRRRTEQSQKSGEAEALSARSAHRTSRQLIFGKYDSSEVKVEDQSLAEYVSFGYRSYPNIFGRRQDRAYYNAHITIVERLANKLMRGGTGKKVGGKIIRTKGRLQGKKIKVMHVLEESFDIINKQTGNNPLQVLVDALQNSAPIEDTTRVRYGGISYNVAVGISSRRRLDVALRNMALAALINAFKNKRKLSESLANELILASTKSPDSYAIKKKVDVERIAKRAR